MSKKAYIFLLVILLVAITTILGAILILDRTSPTAPAPTRPTLGDRKLTEVLNLGNVFKFDEGLNVILTVRVKSVEKQGNDVILSAETKDFKGQVYKNDFLVFRDSVTKSFFLLTSSDLTDFPQGKPNKFDKGEDTKKALERYIGKIVLLNLDLPPSLKYDVLKPYITNVECNERILSFVEGKDNSLPNCTGESLQINVEK